MGNRPIRYIFIWQAVILLMLLALTFANEVLDLPHVMLGDLATTWGQRSGEIYIELFIFCAAITLEIFLFARLSRRIKILEGFLHICAGCKRIQVQDRWVQLESYISEHSLAEFSHSLCHECMKRLYPELFSSKHEKNEAPSRKET
jgi:hypothetical protein